MWVKMDDINVEQKVFRENMYGILEPSSLLRRFETHQKVYFQNQNKSLQNWVHYKPERGSLRGQPFNTHQCIKTVNCM